MSFLFRVIYAWKCSSTHQKIALDSLRRLRGPNAQRWRNVFLRYSDFYLQGAAAPDTSFKDFRNHVLHVQENYWGGATKTATSWYQRTVAALKHKDWREAIYSAGVLSHYYTDPLMPLHTAQEEREGGVHRPAEWSINRSYAELRRIIEEDFGGWPKIKAADGGDWPAQMVRSGAEFANQYYDLFLEHYHLEAGVKNPPAGLDQELKDASAQLIGHAVVGFARILERAFAEANVAPPKVGLWRQIVLKSLFIPVYWLRRKTAERKERAVVNAICREWKRTGKVLKNLPEDEKIVRKLHAKEVLKISLDELDKQKAGLTGTKHGTGAPPRQRQCKRQIIERPKRRYVLSRMPSDAAVATGAEDADKKAA